MDDAQWEDLPVLGLNYSADNKNQDLTFTALSQDFMGRYSANFFVGFQGGYFDENRGILIEIPPDFPPMYPPCIPPVPTPRFRYQTPRPLPLLSQPSPGALWGDTAPISLWGSRGGGILMEIGVF